MPAVQADSSWGAATKYNEREGLNRGGSRGEVFPCRRKGWVTAEVELVRSRWSNLERYSADTIEIRRITLAAGQRWETFKYCTCAVRTASRPSDRWIHTAPCRTASTSFGRHGFCRTQYATSWPDPGATLEDGSPALCSEPTATLMRCGVMFASDDAQVPETAISGLRKSAQNQPDDGARFRSLLLSRANGSAVGRSGVGYADRRGGGRTRKVLSEGGRRTGKSRRVDRLIRGGPSRIRSVARERSSGSGRAHRGRRQPCLLLDGDVTPVTVDRPPDPSVRGVCR